MMSWKHSSGLGRIEELVAATDIHGPQAAPQTLLPTPTRCLYVCFQQPFLPSHLLLSYLTLRSGSKQYPSTGGLTSPKRRVTRDDRRGSRCSKSGTPGEACRTITCHDDRSTATLAYTIRSR